MKKILFYLAVGLVPIVLLYVIVLHVQIQRYSQMEVPKDVDYLIILGAKVNGDIPSLSLQYRIEAAVEYLEQNVHTVAIASGGQGPDEHLTEAEAIKKELLARGIAEQRILLEGQSTSTVENIQFTKEILPTGSNIGIVVTNHYHVYRAVSIARDHELNVYGLSAKTPFISLIKSYLREYLAITKYYSTSMLKKE